MWIKLFLIAAISAFASAAADKVVCYYGSWAVYRQGNGKYAVEDIDPTLCTHLIYGFVGLNSDGSIRVMDAWNDIDLAAFKRFNNLRSRNSNAKTLVAIGGWNEESLIYSNVVSSASLRTAFVNSALNFVQTYGFDGFDLDWEYPGQRGGASTDKDNFSKLLAEFRSVFDQHGFLLTAAVAAAGSSVDISYDVPVLSKYLDFINVMTYDLHGAWESTTGQNAPLYASSIDVTATQKLLNVDACIKGWISRGADPQKIILGVGTYGRSFTLASSSNNKLGAPAIGGGNAGQYTFESGMLGYNEICEKISAGGWTVVWDDEQKVPYAYNGNQWVGYDNEKSIAIKVDYAKAQGLGGIMIWSVETDDFKGVCGSVNPILNTIKNTLGGVIVPDSDSSSSSSSTTTTTTTTTAAPSSSGSVCTRAGYVRDSSNCSVFYYCSTTGSNSPSTFQCPSGLYFDETLSVCNYASAVAC